MFLCNLYIYVEISSGTESLAKLTLAMINYRISLSLLSLNLSIHTEPNESYLFVRNQLTSTTQIASTKAENSVTKNGAKLGTGSSMTVSANLPPAIVVPSLLDSSHEADNSQIVAGGKRLLSADDNSRDDYLSNKRQRSQNADEAGAGREKFFPGTSVHFCCIFISYT